MTSPNIVLILVDDADAKVLEHAASSRIRAAMLFDDQDTVGATATRYLTTHPLCAPSRASLLRGMYPQNTHVTGNNDAYNAFKNNGGESSNIARWLKAAPTSYRTALIGKYMNKYEPVDHGKPDAGFDYWFAVGQDAYNSYNYPAWDDYKGSAGGIRHYGDATDPTNYLTDVLRRKAVQFLDDASTTEPFFLMVTPMAPHAPSIAASQYLDRYLTESYPHNLSFNEADVTDKPWYVSMIDELDQPQIDRIDEWFQKRLQCMESVADLVEAVIGKLHDKGVLDNTYVFFTSDHGFHMGEHRLGHDSLQDEAQGKVPGGKNSMYEEDIRVPLWIRHPGMAVSTVDQLLGNVDLAPTFCQIAGIDLANNPPAVLDGRSFLPLLTGQQVSWRTQYLISRGLDKPFVGFRHADEWVFEQLLNPAPNETKGEYYVGLDDPTNGDPFELDNGYLNLAATQPVRLAALKDLASRYGACAGDTCRLIDSEGI